MWTALALAVLTKGLVALVFFFGAAILYLALTGEWRHWRTLKPFTGLLLFLAIAAPWHILAGLRNTGGMNGHGFFWFYFVNEHFLRFLGNRYPMDYNKLPGYLFWSLHLVWLFPWSLFAPVAVPFRAGRMRYRRIRSTRVRLQTSTTLLLAIFAALVLVFFSLSTNQEYYTFPAYLPLLILTRSRLARSEHTLRRRQLHPAAGSPSPTPPSPSSASPSHPPSPTASGPPAISPSSPTSATSSPIAASATTPSRCRTSSTSPAPASPRFASPPHSPPSPSPSARHRMVAPHANAVTSPRPQPSPSPQHIFLIAAHIALIRFAPMLSSQDFAERFSSSKTTTPSPPTPRSSSSATRPTAPLSPSTSAEYVYLVDGRSTSMLFGSTFPDAPPIFLTHDDLVKNWGNGQRKILFVPLEKRDEVDSLLGDNKILLEETSGKALFTDRPLDQAQFELSPDLSCESSPTHQ